MFPNYQPLDTVAILDSFLNWLFPNWPFDVKTTEWITVGLHAIVITTIVALMLAVLFRPTKHESD